MNTSPASPPSPTEAKPTPSSPNALVNRMILPLLVLVAVGAIAYGVFTSLNPASTTGLVTGIDEKVALAQPQKDTESASQAESGSVDPSDFLSRRVYFEEAFQPDREKYDVFAHASKFTGKPLDQMPAFFGVQNEKEIFSALPPIPTDFSEIAFLLASGKFFAIEGLEEEYWAQPEFYPNFKENGLNYWKEPDPKSWASNGYGTYPAEQWAELKRGETENFEATVFLYSGFGVQTYQGITIFPNAGANSYFDLEISPNTFILEPNFPKFESGWAKKILIKGHLKEGIPPGEYVVALNIGFPPENKRKEWTFQYLNLYQDGASGIRPSGNQITLHVTVS